MGAENRRGWIASGARSRTRPAARFPSSPCAARRCSAGERRAHTAHAATRGGVGAAAPGCSDWLRCRPARPPRPTRAGPATRCWWCCAGACRPRQGLRGRLAGGHAEPGRPGRRLAALRPRHPRVDARPARPAGTDHRNALVSLPRLETYRGTGPGARLQPDLGLAACDHGDAARRRSHDVIRERQPDPRGGALPDCVARPIGRRRLARYSVWTSISPHRPSCFRHPAPDPAHENLSEPAFASRPVAVHPPVFLAIYPSHRSTPPSPRQSTSSPADED